MNQTSLSWIALSEKFKDGLLPRRAAWDVLKAVSAGAFADIALDRAINSNNLSEKDRRLLTELAYGAIRSRELLDTWIEFLGKIPSKKQPPLLRLILHLGLYQILFMEKIPSSAAVNTSVELIKQTNLKKLTPVVNGILRSAVRAKNEGREPQWPVKQTNRLAKIQSLPLWLAKDLVNWRGKEEAESIAKASNRNPVIDLRVNRLISNPKSLQKIFSQKGIQSECIEDCPYGLQLLDGQGKITMLPGFETGMWSVQDRSAQWVANLLNPLPGSRILDACSAPGGKTTHLAELMENHGTIWAVDRSNKRLQKVNKNAKRLGLKIIHTLTYDASLLLNIKPKWLNYFDKILLDAPCSGLGTLSRHPDARWRINPTSIRQLVDIQANILDSLIPLLSANGSLLYSTCTINPDENTLQIKRFLKRNTSLSLENEKQIWPSCDKYGDGFYAALIKKNY